MKKYPVVIFDVDGVLLDSLTSHLKICEDKSKEYKLGLAIPDTEGFKEIVRSGVPVSPMKYFFEVVGFKSPYTEKAVKAYNETFMEEYCPKPFSKVSDLLKRLSDEKIAIGIITSNVRNNVETALGSNMAYFDEDLVFTKDDPNFKSKSQSLQLVAEKLNTDIENILYVGDQQADFESARTAGAKFLGVTYGWGISDGENEFPVVDNVEGIGDYVINGGRSRPR